MNNEKIIQEIRILAQMISDNGIIELDWRNTLCGPNTVIADEHSVELNVNDDTITFTQQSFDPHHGRPFKEHIDVFKLDEIDNLNSVLHQLMETASDIKYKELKEQQDKNLKVKATMVVLSEIEHERRYIEFKDTQNKKLSDDK